MLLSSNVIQICVRVVMLVRMICIDLPATQRAKSYGLAPPLAEFTTLAFLQDQWMPQKLVNGILIEGDLLAPHPGALVSNTLFCGPGVGIKLHDYLWVVLSHG